MKTIIKIAIAIILAYIIITNWTIFSVATGVTVFAVIDFLRENAALLLVIIGLFVSAIVTGKKSKKGEEVNDDGKND